MGHKKIRIIGIPMDLGQTRRGVDMGPSALRYAGLETTLRNLGHEVEDAGNVVVEVKEQLPAPGTPGYIKAIEDVCHDAYAAGKKAIEEDCFPIFLGGDHSVSAGTVGGITDSEEAGLIWIDAHGDFNIPETSPNGNIHGMPLSILIGEGIDSLVNVGRKGPKVNPRNVVLFGIRDLDFDEKSMLRNSGIHIFTMRDIDERGIGTVAREATAKLKHLKRIHVSLDIDVIEPTQAPGVGTPAPGGMTYREAHLLMEMLCDLNSVCSLDLVEINPILDSCNKTAKMAVEFTASLLGKRIL